MSEALLPEQSEIHSGSSSESETPAEEEEREPVKSQPEISAKSSPADTQQRLRALEAAIRQHPIRNANNIVDLFSFITPTNPTASRAIHAARRSLLILEKNQPDDTFAKWLTERRRDYTSRLLVILRSKDHAAHHDAAVASAAITHADVFSPLIAASLASQPLAAHSLVLSCIARFPDLSLLALRLLADESHKYLVQRRLSLLRVCDAACDAPHARMPVQRRDYRAALTNAWLSVLQDSRLENTDRLHLLTQLPQKLLPYMTDPLRLSDFLTACYDNTHGVDVSLAALDGLFTLISKHGLDYPLFYPKLYALLSHDTLCSLNGRHRFLQLVASFLTRGSGLSSTLVAAFVKRLTRRAVSAPTAAALWCLRLALDMLYAHPGASFLVHRSVNLFQGASAAGNGKRKRVGSGDPFDDDELDPLKSHVEDSSLWELDVLRTHVSPAVSRLVGLFSNNVGQKPPPLPGSLDDYAALSFADVFNAEVKRKAKTLHVAYEPPATAAHCKRLKDRLGSSISWT